MAAGQAVEAGPFLPTVEEAETADDREALNLLSRHYLALHAREPKAEHLERAWAVTQAVLAVGEVDGRREGARRSHGPSSWRRGPRGPGPHLAGGELHRAARSGHGDHRRHRHRHRPGPAIPAA